MKSKQAQRIIDKFGGVRRLAEAIGYKYPAVYKWTYDAEKGGTDGYIPNGAIQAIKSAADILGIDLTAEDWAP